MTSFISATVGPMWDELSYLVLRLYRLTFEGVSIFVGFTGGVTLLLLVSTLVTDRLRDVVSFNSYMILVCTLLLVFLVSRKQKGVVVISMACGIILAIFVINMHMDFNYMAVPLSWWLMVPPFIILSKYGIVSLKHAYNAYL